MRGVSERTLIEGERRLPELINSDPNGGIGVAEELFALNDALRGSKELNRMLADPTSTPEVKDQIITRLLGGKFSQPVIAFVESLVKGRFTSDADLAESLEQLGRDAALAEAAESGRLDRVEDELFDLADSFNKGSGQAREFLSDKESDPAKRVAVIDRLLADRADPITVLLARRCTANLQGGSFVAGLDQLAEAIAARKAHGVARVASAVPLTEAQKQRLENILQRKYGHAIEVHVNIDPGIIGGLRIEIGPDVIDDTVPTRLAKARAAMVA